MSYTRVRALHPVRGQQSVVRSPYFILTIILLAPVVQKVDNAIHQINHYPLDIAIGFAITYPVDSDLSGG